MIVEDIAVYYINILIEEEEFMQNSLFPVSY